MIELKNVVKNYKSKKGHTTTALGNISLKFDNKGMTFILGKSGSGKSTMLNVIGGLDKCDSGDIVILGKSTKNFKKDDFDSYRNTYVGFVFQEFNILEDYNVYENIALALQLQRKNIDKEKIDALLEKLELKDLKTRKVNELSGGQRQRVAIARALIKDPKIILADEPTGNLDSTTGKQVMDLLKEISKERLVIIVSHDSEFANIYGDRIVEISDGNIIRDTGQDTNIDDGDNYKIIKSKLPLKDSFKLGIGSLRHKKIKLFFTILLTICTLLFLSVTDTLSTYDVEKAHAKLLVDKKENFVKVEKFYFSNSEDPDDFSFKDQVKLGLKDEKNIESKIKNKYYPIYKLQETYYYTQIGDLLKLGQTAGDNLYTYQGSYSSANIVVLNDFENFINEEIIGRYPNNYNEILISNYLADLIINGGITTYEKNDSDEFSDEYTFKPKDYIDIINSNKTFYLGDEGKVKIVGIINYDLSKYSPLKSKKYDFDTMDREDRILYDELKLTVNNLYGNIYVNEDFIKNLDVVETEELDQSVQNYMLSTSDDSFGNDAYYITPAVLQKEIEYYDGTEWKKTESLKENEVILNIYQLISGSPQNYKSGLEKYISNNPNEDREILEKKYFVNYIKDYDVIGKTVDFTIKDKKDKVIKEYKDLKIVGIFGIGDSSRKNYYLSYDLVGEYKINPLSKVGYLVPMTEYKDFEYMLETFPYNKEIQTVTPYSEDVTMLIKTIDMLKDISSWVSLVLFVFTVFLIGNFIMTSIHYRKKEIGVLRALGSRSIDVVKIFLWEGLIMSFISATISAILLIIVTNFLNNFIMTGTNMILTPFILGVRQFVIIYLVVFIVTIISCIIPVIKISKMRPIDAILNK